MLLPQVTGKPVTVFQLDRFMVFRVRGRVCAVFGGSRGIGRAVSEALAIRGGNIAVLSRDKDRAAECVNHLRSVTSCEKHLSLNCDVSCYISVQNCLKDVQNKLGQVSVLVNVAGVNYDSLLLRTDAEQMKSIINTNLVGAMYTSQAVLKHMLRERNGVIINIGSVVGMKGNTGQCVYAASKSGIHKLLSRGSALKVISVLRRFLYQHLSVK